MYIDSLLKIYYFACARSSLNEYSYNIFFLALSLWNASFVTSQLVNTSILSNPIDYCFDRLLF